MNFQAPHLIRLWGPWQIKAVPDDSAVSTQERRINFKRDLAVESFWEPAFQENFQGDLMLSRKFNRPTGLVPNQRLAIEIDLKVDTFAGLGFLNHSNELGSVNGGLQSIDVHDLANSNLLQLVFAVPAGGLVDFPLPPFHVMHFCIWPSN